MPVINIHPDDLDWLARLLDESVKRADLLNKLECERALSLANRIVKKIPDARAKYAADLEASRGWKRAIAAGHIKPRRTWA